MFCISSTGAFIDKDIPASQRPITLLSLYIKITGTDLICVRIDCFCSSSKAFIIPRTIDV